MSTATFVYLKETIKLYYQKHAGVIDPIAKFVLSLVTLFLFRNMFPYSTGINWILIIVLFSVAQAFLPILLLYFGVAALVLFNVFAVSSELFAGYLIFFLICLLLFTRVDGKYAVIIVLTPLLFFLKLEFFLPVVLGMTAGLGGVLPMAAGILIYFSGTHILEATYLLPAAAQTEVGYSLSGLINEMFSDQTLWVVIVAFCAVVILAACLMRLLYENAWLVAILAGNAAAAFLLLVGKLLFLTNYGIARVLAELVIAIFLAAAVQFFRGIGDVTRMEKVTFEDEDYIYYVKAVPKIKTAKRERSVTDIVPEGGTGGKKKSPGDAQQKERVHRITKSQSDKNKKEP